MLSVDFFYHDWKYPEHKEVGSMFQHIAYRWKYLITNQLLPMFKHTCVFRCEMSMKALHNLKLHSDTSHRVLLHIHALYELADTRANTRLMHWYVLSENINNVTESLM